MEGEHSNRNTDTTAGGQHGGAQSSSGTASSGLSPRGWGLLIVGAIVLALLFLTAAAIALILIAGPGGGRGSVAAPQTFEEKYVSGEGADKIAVLPIIGLIGSEEATSLATPAATPETLRNQLRQAAKDNRVKAIVLEVNSAGGGVVASDQMHESIQDFKETTNKPVVVSMNETAASGGYYVATAADQIVANPGTLTGSLGVILSILNYEEAAEKLGLEEEVFKSDAFKDLFSGSRERTPEEREIIQSLVDQDYERFVEVIVEGRNMPEERVRELADGRIYSGRQAESLGLVDDLGDLQRAAEISRELADVEEATVVRYQKAPGFFELLRARLGPSKPEALKILESSGLSLTPETQYLYRP